MTTKPQMTPPPLDTVMAFRGVYVINEIAGHTETGALKLKAIRYASVLLYGREPLWGLWSVSGKFLRFYGSRAAIEKDYPNLPWRRKMARWSLIDGETDYSKPSKRVGFLEHTYHKKVK